VLAKIPGVAPIRLVVITLLLIGAYYAAAPWLGCVVVLPFWQVQPVMLRVCTFGDNFIRPGYGLPGFAGPYWGNLIVGLVYVAAAILVVRRRPRL